MAVTMAERIRAVEVGLNDTKEAICSQTVEIRAVGIQVESLKNYMVSELRLKADKEQVERLEKEVHSNRQSIYDLAYKVAMIVGVISILANNAGLW